jgi:hypothetical protein
MLSYKTIGRCSYEFLYRVALLYGGSANDKESGKEEIN